MLISQSMFDFFEKVIECVEQPHELEIVAHWVADECEGDEQALIYFKDLCLQKLEEIKNRKLKQVDWMSMYQETVKA